MRKRVAVIISLMGLVVACDPVVPELSEDTIFDRPALNSSESQELVQILNAHRKNWRRYWATDPAGLTAFIEISPPSESDTQIYLSYFRTATSHCSLIGSRGRTSISQSFPESICERLNAILVKSSTQGGGQDLLGSETPLEQKWPRSALPDR